MRKISFVLAFVLVIQASSPSFAQSSTFIEAIELVDCWNDQFDKLEAESREKYNSKRSISWAERNEFLRFISREFIYQYYYDATHVGERTVQNAASFIIGITMFRFVPRLFEETPQTRNLSRILISIKQARTRVLDMLNNPILDEEAELVARANAYFRGQEFKTAQSTQALENAHKQMILDETIVESRIKNLKRWTKMMDVATIVADVLVIVIAYAYYQKHSDDLEKYSLAKGDLQNILNADTSRELTEALSSEDEVVAKMRKYSKNLCDQLDLSKTLGQMDDVSKITSKDWKKYIQKFNSGVGQIAKK